MLTRNDRVWQKLVVATCTLNEKHLAFLCLHPVKHVGTWVVTRWCRARSRDSGKGAQGHAHHANCPHPNCSQSRCHCKRERRGRSTRITGFGDFAMISQLTNATVLKVRHRHILRMGHTCLANSQLHCTRFSNVSLIFLPWYTIRPRQPHACNHFGVLPVVRDPCQGAAPRVSIVCSFCANFTM